MNEWLLLPPIAFGVLALFMWLQYRGLRLFSRGVPPSTTEGTTKPYSCGEDLPQSSLQPEYEQFFPFAFFFTIMHVVALMVATFPSGNAAAVPLAAVYLIAAVVGVSILYRR